MLSVAQQSALAASLAEGALPALGGCDDLPPDDVLVWVDAGVDAGPWPGHRDSAGGAKG